MCMIDGSARKRCMTLGQDLSFSIFHLLQAQAASLCFFVSSHFFELRSDGKENENGTNETKSYCCRRES